MTAAVCILAVCAVIIYAAQPVTAWWDRRTAERPESLSKRHDRLDVEANVAAYERLGRSANR